ncbi:hypothetical protein [Evansella cellulosilytica]|uniref:Uncharacterized protein n=1 Tax=Evansella cellulosilytica (strain ATCC 21833 / DSM 2522 / FERM P-1141 / JCM 9156 / N-4) TaxID=649639 RepID=E6TQB2_EVAC2|nr:hypothetical protein [Evansella cellulosilytica]ADU29290.1 hypothetical protein Bcell_1017 [Evansella cellulosilytica DSM 2522]
MSVEDFLDEIWFPILKKAFIHSQYIASMVEIEDEGVDVDNYREAMEITDKELRKELYEKYKHEITFHFDSKFPNTAG